MAWVVVATLTGCAEGEATTTDSDSVGPTGNPTLPTTSEATETTQTNATDGTDTQTSQGPTTDTNDTDTTASTNPTSDPTDATTDGGCGACDEPNQTCIDDVCMTSCQGQTPDPCGPDQVCDVLSGTCVDAGETCILTGTAVACDDQSCGPGTVCDGQGACIAVAPCNNVTCTSEGDCWGTACTCERPDLCNDAPADLLNGPFATNISGLDFADDCNAWAVTVSGGQEFVRRMTPEGQLTEWGAVGDYDIGEVRVLRQLQVPASGPTSIEGLTSDGSAVEGLGEVALTYICCPVCGSCANNPEARGVARLDEENINMPLPIIIFAAPTQGDGPFGEIHLDGGPQGLTWGEDRVLYVGNTTANGDLNTADLEAETADVVFQFDTRVTASAPVSDVHILVAVLGGSLYLFNTETLETTFVVDLMHDVTSMSHDAFNGDVYASIRNLEIVRVRPFTGEVETFATMPSLGRIAVSPSGNLWFTPVKYLADGILSAWELPTVL